MRSNTLSLIATTGVVMTSCTQSPAPRARPHLTQGSTYHGFELRQVKELPELGSRGLYFVHLKSGAQLIKLESDDNNKVFSITFKTPPDSDTGLPHILEHSVLNGSKSFPVKSPFDVLRQGSLNTFLNAFTSDDFTMYPVASTNQTDFFNLMHVYLDAVFYPRIYQDERIFQQEGWRYELESRDGPLTTNGVVYNEMKGALSSPERVLGLHIQKQLFPEATYGNFSGGIPQAIVELRPEDLTAFHRKYYRPSNSYIYLYGDGDTDRELAFIDSQYLSDFDRQEVDARITAQKAPAEPRELVTPYPVASNEDPANKAYLSQSWVVSSATEPVDSFLLQVLAEVLVNLPDAPIRRALLEAGIGSDYSASFDPLKQGVFSIKAEKANAADRFRFRQIIDETLTKLLESGLSADDVEGVVNTREFSLREADYGGFPKGLVYGFFGTRAWMLGEQPFLSFGFEETLQDAKKAITAGRLEALIRGLTTNQHAALVVVEPKPGMQDDIEAANKKKLVAVKAPLSPAELDTLVAQTQKLKEYQRTPDTREQLATIPMLTLADLNTQSRPMPVVEKTLHATRVLISKQKTAGITYVKHLFSVHAVPGDKLGFLSLLADILGLMSTTEHPYGDLRTEINLHTGGIESGLEVFPEARDPSRYHPALFVSGKVLTPKLNKLLDLQREIIMQSLLDDEQRLKEVMLQLHARLQAMVQNAGHQIAVQRLSAGVSPAGWFREQTSGLTYAQFVSEWVGGIDEHIGDLTRELQVIRDLVFRQPNLTMALVGNDADVSAFTTEIPGFLEGLPKDSRPLVHWSWQPAKKREGLLGASKVQYVVQGANFNSLGFVYDGRLEVLGNILSRGYLQQSVRVENGAYGSWAAFSRSGVGYFASYRDPELQKTIDAYQQAAHYLESFAADKRSMTRYIIGTIAERDQPYSPRVEGMRAIDYTLRGISDAMRQKERDQILAATAADIREQAKLVEALTTNTNVCVYGNEQTLRASSELFDELTPVTR